MKQKVDVRCGNMMLATAANFWCIITMLGRSEVVEEENRNGTFNSTQILSPLFLAKFQRFKILSASSFKKLKVWTLDRNFLCWKGWISRQWKSFRHFWLCSYGDQQQTNTGQLINALQLAETAAAVQTVQIHKCKHKQGTNTDRDANSYKKKQLEN